MLQRILIFSLLICFNYANATKIKISTLNELAHYATKSDNVIIMTPGIYQLSNYLTVDSMSTRHIRNEFQFITFSGSNNVFKLSGVTIEVDNKLRTALNPPTHTNEFVITGQNNSIKGLTIRYKGEGTSKGGAALEVGGKENTLKDITLHVNGSSPYGYGDLLGKGKRKVVNLNKHSGLLVTGRNTKLYGCKVFMKSLGHAFFIQNGYNTHFENCYAEGELRSTDEMLAEKSGPAFDHNFASVYKNYNGEKVITPGYMKSLNECGFRTYTTGPVTAINCVAKNMRVGFALEKVTLKNCEAINCERGYYLKTAVAKNCRGDANYGPLIYLVGEKPSKINLTLMPGETDMKVHAIATVCGSGHQLSIKRKGKEERKKATPIMLGYGMPDSGEISCAIPEKAAENIKIKNSTTLPVIIGKLSSSCTLTTNGLISSNLGEDILINIK